MRADAPADFVSHANRPARLVPVPTAIIVGAWFLFAAVFLSDAALDLGLSLVFVFGSLLWAAVWLVRLVVSIVRRRRGVVPHPAPRPAFLYWAFEPAALIVCVALVWSGALFQVRFRLGRPSLDAYVADVIAGRAPEHGFDTPKHWVGLFRIAETELLPNGVVRVITTSTFLDDAGLAYSRAAPPPRIGEDVYRPLGDSWYQWYRSW